MSHRISKTKRVNKDFQEHSNHYKSNSQHKNMNSELQLNRERIFKAQIRGASKRFIHQMYLEFGIAQEPKSEICFEGLGGSVGLREEFKEIQKHYHNWLKKFPPSLTHQVYANIPSFINELTNEEFSAKLNEGKYVCFHETAHYLHMIKNWQFFLDKTSTYKDPFHIYCHSCPGTQFAELVAELGVITFLIKNRG